MKTAQEALNAVMEFAYAQNEKCMINISTQSMCAYRGHGGKKCFIGSVIPDKGYKKGMESQGYDLLMSSYPEIQSAFTIKDFSNLQESEFWSDLQIIHDENDVKHWADCFSDFALHYDLQIEVQP